ncbi:hypothetical protein AC579_3950 [Pseudocercospora musae]|uniref:Ubiquitin 3 binding protein But2 C-terminal domain-containing protein n=1 Tax=Pseudocercospora musae TaxID=113226 RepID=A0A139IKP6_9PEZI|nr:hypothetical protein AC579_3950 [Pseudocercospora musae]
MLQIMSKILAAGLTISMAHALPANIRATSSSVDTTCTTRASTRGTDPTASVTDLPSFTLRPRPNSTTTAVSTVIPPPFAPSVLDTSYALRSDTDSVTLTTSTTIATKTVEKRSICTDFGIVHECATAPPTDGSGTTYNPSLPSDFASPVCGDTSSYDGSTDSTILAAADNMCNKANWNIMVDPSNTLRWTAEATDGNDMTFSIDFDWLAVPADQNSVLFHSAACHVGFEKLVTGCKSDAQPLMTGGHVEGKFSGVPVTFFVSVQLATGGYRGTGGLGRIFNG